MELLHSCDSHVILGVAEHMRHQSQQHTTPVPWRPAADQGVYALCMHVCHLGTSALTW